MTAAIQKTKGKNCLDGSLLLAISRGEVCEPSLSQFLEHLDECLVCCERSMELLRREPDPLDHLMKAAFHSMTVDEPGMDGVELASPVIVQGKSRTLLPRNLETVAIPSWLDIFRNKNPRMSSPPYSPAGEPGTSNQFGKYHIEAILGEGSSSVVFRAMDTELERLVALKVLRPEVAADPNKAECFLREAQALARVRSPHVVRLISYGRSPSPYLTMDLLEGNTLSREMEKGPIEPNRSVRIVREIAYGLQAIHQTGMVHRDIKPSNIWLQTGVEGERAVLMDLGLVASDNPRIGTPGYTAPEVLKNIPPRPPADIFSLGVVLRAMALGGHPDDHSGEKPPGNLASLISLMTHPNPGGRPTALDVIDITCDWFGKKKRAFSGWMVPALALASALALGGWFYLQTLEQPVQVEKVARASPGLPANRLLENAFTPEIASNQNHFGISKSGYLVLQNQILYRRDPVESEWREFTFPFKVMESCLEGDRLAVSSPKGVIQVYDVGLWPPALMANFPSPGNANLGWMCLSLAQDGSGKLLASRSNTLFMAEPKNGIYPPDLTPRQSTMGLTTGARAPMAAVLDQNGSGVFALMPFGGVSLSTLDLENRILWYFKPIGTGPAAIALRPGAPGALAIASPEGYLGLFGPDLVLDKKGNTIPLEHWSRKFPGPVFQPRFVSESHLAFITTEGPCPLKVLHVKNRGKSVMSLACANPVAIATEPASGLLHCLDAEGNIHSWTMDFAKRGGNCHPPAVLVENR